MPAYNFQGRFVEAILDGSKRQTIRRRRKRPTKSGDVLQLYTGMRTKQCRLLKTVDCTSVVPIQIHPDTREVYLDGKRLVFDDMQRFSKRDGFKNVYEFLEFFERYPLSVRENELEVIYWR